MAQYGYDSKLDYYNKLFGIVYSKIIKKFTVFTKIAQWAIF